MKPCMNGIVILIPLGSCQHLWPIARRWNMSENLEGTHNLWRFTRRGGGGEGSKTVSDILPEMFVCVNSTARPLIRGAANLFSYVWGRLCVWGGISIHSLAIVVDNYFIHIFACEPVHISALLEPENTYIWYYNTLEWKCFMSVTSSKSV